MAGQDPFLEQQVQRLRVVDDDNTSALMFWQVPKQVSWVGQCTSSPLITQFAVLCTALISSVRPGLISSQTQQAGSSLAGVR